MLWMLFVVPPVILLVLSLLLMGLGGAAWHFDLTGSVTQLATPADQGNGEPLRRPRPREAENETDDVTTGKGEALFQVRTN